MGGGAFARNFRDNFDETVCRGTSYRILTLTSSVQLPIILSSFIISTISATSASFFHENVIIIREDMKFIIINFWRLGLADWEITIHKL